MATRKLTVLGATGQIGQVLTRELLKRGHQVRAVGRDERKLASLKTKGAEVLPTGFEDAGHLMEAFAGADGVFVMIPPGYGVDDFGAHQDRVGEAIKDAIVRSKVRKVVNLSSIGAQHADKTGPIKGLYRQERRLNACLGVDVLHLRPSFFMQNFFWSIPTIRDQGMVLSSIKGDSPLWMVSTDDIGRKAAEILGSLAFSGHSVFDFAGPREVTHREATAILAKAIGRADVSYIENSYAEQAKMMLMAGMGADITKLMVEMQQAANDGLLAPTEMMGADHKGPTTIEAFARDFAQMYKRMASK